MNFNLQHRVDEDDCDDDDNDDNDADDDANDDDDDDDGDFRKKDVGWPFLSQARQLGRKRLMDGCIGSSPAAWVW